MNDTAMTVAPPEVTQAQRAADSMFAMVDAYEIDSPAMFEAAGSELQNIRARWNAIEAQRVHLKEPFLVGSRRIDAFFKTPLDRLTEAGNLLKQRMLTFQTAEKVKQAEIQRQAEAEARAERERQETIRRAAEAEERRVREIAAEAQRKADAEAAEARKSGDEAAARVAEETARVAQEEARQAAAACAARVESVTAEIELAEIAPVTAPTVLQPKAAGISTRQTWKGELLDLEALVTAAAAGIANGDRTLVGYLQFNEKAIGAVAKALKNQARIPGVRIYAEDSLAVRSAA